MGGYKVVHGAGEPGCVPMTPYEVARGAVELLEAGRRHPYATTTCRMVEVVSSLVDGRLTGVRRMEETLVRDCLPAADIIFTPGRGTGRAAVLDARHLPALTYGYNLWKFFAWEDESVSLRPLEVLEALGPQVVEVAIELQATGLDVVDVTQMAESAFGVEPLDWRLP